MKKLIALAAIATCGAALAIESANIVGYQQVTIPAGYTIMTPTFQNVDATSFDLTAVIPLRNDGSVFGTDRTTRCNGAITIQKMSDSGNYTAAYSYYYMEGKIGWYDGSDTAVTAGSVTFSDGEAMLVNNQYKNTSVLFQVSGAVNLINQNIVPAGYSLFGNSTPVTVNLSAVEMRKNDGEVFGTDRATRCNGAITIQKITTGGNYSTAYSYYYMDGKIGWYDGEGTKVENDSVTLTPGEAFLVNNQYKGVAVMIVLPSPITE